MSEILPADGVPPLGYLVELFDSDRASVASLAHVLTGALSDALPAGTVVVDYERSMSDRLHGRPGQAVGVVVTLGDQVLSLTTKAGHRVEATVARAVRGVVLSRRPVTVTEWVTALAQAIRSLAEQDAQARATLQRLLLG